VRVDFSDVEGPQTLSVFPPIRSVEFWPHPLLSNQFDGSFFPSLQPSLIGLNLPASPSPEFLRPLRVGDGWFRIGAGRLPTWWARSSFCFSARHRFF